MHIALISPLLESVPPKLYGGTERVVANLCQGLAALGHEVTLFASADSTVPVEVVATVKRSQRLGKIPLRQQVADHIGQLAAVIRRRRDFDIIHNHNDIYGFPLALLSETPVVTTLHGRLDESDMQQALRQYPELPYVSISGHQRLPAPELNWIATVYHGLPLDQLKFSPGPGRYLAFLGRISPEKRPDLAIDIARKAGVPLKIAAKIDPIDGDYFERFIKPRIDGHQVEYLGEISDREKSEFLGGALGLLFPIDWPEPFGIAPVEAWACGTPVLARPYGSVPELHVDGVTGFVRDDADELAALVPRLFDFDRAQCRAYAERNFSLSRMCKDYIDVYRQLLRSTAPVRQSLQPGKSHDHRRGVLHPVNRAPTRHRQDRSEG